MRRRRFGVWSAACSAVACVLLGDPSFARAVTPHRTMTTLTSSNGLGALVYDATAYKITQFLEHPYQAASSSTTTRNFAYDSYPGIRIGTTGTWLNTVTPTVVEYLPGTGIIHVQRTLQSLTIDEYDFEPMTLTENAAVMLVKVTQNGTAGPIDLYSLFNYNVGTGNPPSSSGESSSYDTTNDAYYEYGGASATMVFGSLTASSFHGADSATGGDNPYGLLTSGSNLRNDSGTTNVTGAIEGFQTTVGTLTQGASAWAGWVSILAPDPNNGEAAITTAKTWLNGRSLAALLSDEQSYWSTWLTASPAGASATESALDQQSQVMLKMAQVTEAAPANGQIMAALPNTPPPASPTSGNWNITWVRDMAYSTVALARSGHYAEARAALQFQLGASTGNYVSDVGVSYQISVCRYYGNGTEWSDSNGDGPNIEFDGFGLFLWALDEYVKASGDTAFLTTWWPTVRTRVGDVLVFLQQSNGLISADSSIWEVHWNGQQRHFTYTTAAAANGLCAASHLATSAGDSASATSYLTHGKSARDALMSQERGPTGALGQSPEAILSGTAWLDASVVEAFNWGLIDPTKATAKATLNAMLMNLQVSDGEGFMRDQTGAWYDSQEWVFVDLRSAYPFALAGNNAFSTSLFGWNTAQSSDNFNEVSELYNPGGGGADAGGAYEGSPPMVGFGAGAYMIALRERGTSLTPACGSYAVETAAPTDAGATSDAGSDAGTHTGDAMTPMVDSGSSGTPDAKAPGDATTTTRDAGLSARDSGSIVVSRGSTGSPDGGTAPSSSGGCSTNAQAPTGWAWALPLLGAGVFVRRRRKTVRVD